MLSFVFLAYRISGQIAHISMSFDHKASSIQAKRTAPPALANPGAAGPDHSADMESQLAWSPIFLPYQASFVSTVVFASADTAN